MKITIKNRKGKRIAAEILHAKQSHGLAIIVPGLGGNIRQPLLLNAAKSFSEFTILRFDPTNNAGKSDGNLEKATTTGMIQDLEEVIRWAKKQTWYSEPFILIGHSLGGLVCMIYAERNPKKIKALALLAPAVSGKLSLSKYSKKDIAAYKRRGYEERFDRRRKKMIRLPWSHMRDRLKYDAIQGAKTLTMPISIVVGTNDKRTSANHHRMLLNKLKGQTELTVIPDANHNFTEHQVELSLVLKRWSSIFSDELVDVVDKNDRVLGTATKGFCHSKGLRHRSVAVLIENAQKKIVVQIRAKNKIGAGLLDNSASGHIAAGDSYKNAALRELKEERGITCKLKKIAKLEEDHWRHGPHIVHVWELFVGKHNGPYHYQKSELAGIKLMALKELQSLIKTKPNTLCEGFKQDIHAYARWKK
ncbi:alpha/beta fold hydrolase [Candidatus Woesearchaeota archaeon]|nr:alpha/beta fold hydrolase [Candidatus Woesearchaeota archaeon]